MTEARAEKKKSKWERLQTMQRKQRAGREVVEIVTKALGRVTSQAQRRRGRMLGGKNNAARRRTART